MLIFLGIVGELATIVLSVIISVNGAFDGFLEISKNGYKIEKKAIEKFQKKLNEEQQKKSNIFSKVLGTIILLTPGVNIIKSAIVVHQLKKKIMDVPVIRDAIVPMNEDELREYAKLNGKLEKIAFASFVIDGDVKEQEIVGSMGGKTLVVDHGLTSIYNSELFPLDYTLDEVKRLNGVMGYSYRIGKMEGKNVAIIGIPNPDSLVSRLQFKNEGYKKVHDYDKMTEEEAKEAVFTVYPFLLDEDNQKKVEEIVEEIKASRISSAVDANLNALIDNEEIVTTYSSEGPILRRKY